MLYSGLNQHNSNLREHQIEAKGKIFDAWDKYDSVMLQMPTGTGKTYLFTSIINDLLAAYKKVHHDIHILVVVHRMELLDQISATLSRFGIAHGIIQGGHDDVEHTSNSPKDSLTLRVKNYEFDESRLSEDNEEMMVVRGASGDFPKIGIKEELVSVPPHIEEISLCDYYLIRGNSDKFKVYPFIKKRGKITGAVVNCIYEYDAKLRPITFTENTTENVWMVDSETKLQTIIAFSAMLLRMPVNEILDLENLCYISQTEIVKKTGLFEVLKMISKIKL